MATNQKTLQTRIKLKYDTYENWHKNNPILLAGEIACVSVAAKPTKDVNSIAAPQILFKVGNGTVSSTGQITGTDFDTLPWASGLAADVYEWAKAQFLPITGTNGVVASSNASGATVQADLVDYQKNTAAATKGTGAKIYAVELDKDGHLSVVVPWTDTDTVYTGNAPIEVNASTKTISHKKKGPTADYTKGASTASIKGSGAKGTIKIPKITVDTYGHVNTAEDESVDIELPTLPTVGNGTLTIKVGDKGDVSGTGSFTANQTTAGTITLPVYTKTEIDKKLVGAVEYLGTVGNLTELNAKDPKHQGDFVRVSLQDSADEWKYNGETLHSGDLLLCETIKSGDTAATWSVIHGEIDKYTWVKNAVDSDGYVTAPGKDTKDKVWKTDENGNPGWRDDETGIVSVVGNDSAGSQKVFSHGGLAFAEGPITGGSKEVSVALDTTTVGSATYTRVLIGLKRGVSDAYSTEGGTSLASLSAVQNALSKLNVTETGTDNSYVSNVRQVDGKIVVSRKTLPDAVQPNSGKLTDRAGTEIFNANQSDDSKIMIIDCGTSSTVL